MYCNLGKYHQKFLSLAALMKIKNDDFKTTQSYSLRIQIYILFRYFVKIFGDGACY